MAAGLRDETWRADAGPEGWVVLMKDDAIRRRPAERQALIAGGSARSARRPAERQALIAGGVRAFCLTNAQLCGEDMARRFVENRHRILPGEPPRRAVHLRRVREPDRTTWPR